MRPCCGRTPLKLSERSNCQREKSPVTVSSSSYRYQQRTYADRHKLSKSDLHVAPFVRLQEETEGAHLVVRRPLFANARIGVERQLAIPGLPEDRAGETQCGIGSFDTGEGLRQAIA